jgi:GTP-binding protein YchF
LADLATVERRREKAQKSVKSGDKTARSELEVLDKLQPALEQGRSARTVELTSDEKAVARNFFLLTTKPTIYAANVDEATLASPDENAMVQSVQEIAEQEAAETVVICAQLEAELVELPLEERADYLQSLGLATSGVDRLIRSAYHLLGLMSFLTAGEKEVRAWTIPQGTRAQTAAGTIHSDIERGFIRAEVISYEDLVGTGSYATARDKGLLRLEGKDYIMQEGDVVHFRFNV